MRRGWDVEALANQAMAAAVGSRVQLGERQIAALRACLKRGSRVCIEAPPRWGKALVGVLAARLLSDAGKGPVVVLASSSRRQARFSRMAERFGLRVRAHARVSPPTIAPGECFIVSPEQWARLAAAPENQTFIGKVALLVLDEWQFLCPQDEEFRAPSVEVVRWVASADPGLRVLALSSGAPAAGLDGLAPPGTWRRFSESLVPNNVRLSVYQCSDAVSRMAWVADFVGRLPGPALIYSQTRSDARRVAEWLRSRGTAAEALCYGIGSAERKQIENRFASGACPVVVATPAYGLSLDLSKVAGVIHFQRPTTARHWIRQIGDIGRRRRTVEVAILTGSADDSIAANLVRAAFPSEVQSHQAWVEVRRRRPTFEALVRSVGAKERPIARWVAAMWAVGAIGWQGDRLRVIRQPSLEELELVPKLLDACLMEARAFGESLQWPECRLQTIRRLIGESEGEPCGQCDICMQTPVPIPPRALVLSADAHLHPKGRLISVRKTVPRRDGQARAIPERLRLLEGAALAGYGDGAWGRLVQEGKYESRRYSDELIEPCVRLIRRLGWNPEWIAWIPNHGDPDLVGDFAQRVSRALGVPASPAIRLVAGSRQKDRATLAQRREHASRSISVDPTHVRCGECLLLDDIVDSGWTLTIAGIALRKAGSGPVRPFALAVC